MIKIIRTDKVDGHVTMYLRRDDGVWFSRRADTDEAIKRITETRRLSSIERILETLERGEPSYFDEEYKITSWVPDGTTNGARA